MLGPAFRWNDSDDMSVLFLRYGSVATIKRREGRVEVEINWAGRKVRGTDGSIRLARRGVERWIAARGGSHEKRRPYEPSAEVRRKWVAEESLAALVRRR